MLAYYGWLLLIVVLSPNPTVVLPYVIATPIVFLILFTVPPLIYSQRSLLPLFLSITGALFTFLGIVFLLLGDMVGLDLTYTGRSTYLGYEYRIQSVFSNSNNLGMFLAFGSLSSIYLVFRNRSKTTIGLLALNVLGLLLSHGRNSLGAFVLGLLFMWFYRHTTILSLGLIMSIIAGHLFIFSDIVSQEVWTDLLSNRNHDMIAGAIHFLEYPLFGTYFDSVETTIGVDQGHPGSHHTYFSMLTRAGVGGIPYILGILYIFVSGSRIIQTLWQRYVFGALAAFIAIMTFETITIAGLSIESLLLVSYIGFIHFEVVRCDSAQPR